MLPITLEMVKKKQQQQLITAFSFVFVYWEYHAENAGDGISEALNLKIFWVSMPPDSPPPPPQDWGAFVFLLPSFSPCTFKSSRCWLQVSYSLWNQCPGMEEAGGGGGKGQVHFKIYLQGGYNFHMKLFRRGRGMIHHTFLKTPFPLWDVINDRP